MVGIDARVTVGLISDTHGWLDPRVIEIFDEYGVEKILHAGDIGDPGVLSGLEEVAPTIAVRGNIDGGVLRDLPLEAVVEVGGKRLAVLHIAGSPKRPNKVARTFLLRSRPDLLLVGHSHIPVVAKVQGALWVNPGAAGRQGFHKERFAALLHISAAGEVGTAAFALDRISLGPRSGLKPLT